MKRYEVMWNKLNSSDTQPNNAEQSSNKSRFVATEQQPVRERPTRWVRLRLFPVWLRILLVIVLLVVAAMAGLIIGYSIIGDGNASDAMKASTWQHIFDIIEGKQ